MAVPMANDPPFATLNHFAADLGIPSESDLLRVGIRSLCRAARCPAISEDVVRLLGLDPDLAPWPSATGKLDLLPERGTRFQIVHQELGAGESILTVSGGGDDEDDVFAGLKPAKAVDHRDSEQRPAPLGRLDVTHDLGLGHSRIMLKRQSRKRGIRLVLPAYSGKRDHGADIAATAAELGRLARGIERLALQSDGGGHLHFSGLS